MTYITAICLNGCLPFVTQLHDPRCSKEDWEGRPGTTVRMTVDLHHPAESVLSRHRELHPETQRSAPSTSIPSSVTDTLHQQWLLQPVSPHLLQTPYTNSDSFNQYPLICYRHLTPTVTPSTSIPSSVTDTLHQQWLLQPVSPHLLQTPYTNSDSFNQYPLICYRHLTPTVTPSTSIPSSVTDTLHQQWLLQPVSPHLLQTPYTNSDSFNQYPLICYRHLTPTVTPSTSIPSSVTDTLHQQWLLQPVSPHLLQTPYTNSDSFNQYPLICYRHLNQQWLLQPVSPHLLQTPYNSDSFNQYPLICYRHLTPTVTPSTSIPSSVTDTLHQQWLLQPVSPHLLQTPYTNSDSFNQYPLICYRHLTPTVTPSTSIPSSVTDTLHQQCPSTSIICYRHLTPTVTPSTSIPSSVTDTLHQQWLLQPVSPHLLQTPYTNSGSFNQYPLICYRHLTPTVTPSTSIPSSVTDTLHQQWLLQPVSPHLLQTPYTNSDSFNQYPLICYRHLTPTVTPSTSIPSSVTDTLHQQWLLQPVSPHLLQTPYTNSVTDTFCYTPYTTVTPSTSIPSSVTSPYTNSVLQQYHLLQTPYTNSDSFNQYPLICYRHLTPTVTPSTSIPSSVTDTLHQQWLLQPVSPHLLQTPYTNSDSFNQYPLICYRHLTPTVTPSTSINQYPSSVTDTLHQQCPSTSIPSSVTDTLHQQWLLQPVSPHLLQTPYTNSGSFNQYPLICYRHLTPTVTPSTSIPSSVTDTLHQQWLLQPVSPHLLQTPYTNSGSFNQYPLICYRHLTPTVTPSTSIPSSVTDTLHQQWLLQPVSPHLLQTPYTNSDSFNQYPLICYRHLTPTVTPSTSIPSSVTDTLHQQWLLQPVSPHLLQTPYTNSDSFNQYPLICYRHLTPTVTPSTSIPSSVTDTLHQQWLLQPVSPHLLQTPYTNSGSFNQYPLICYRHLTPTVTPSTSIPSSVTDTLHQQWLLQPVSPHLLQTPYTNSDSFNQYPLICYRHLTPTVAPSTSIPSSVTDTLHQQWLLQPVSSSVTDTLHQQWLLQPVSPHLLQTPYTNTLHQQWLLQPVSPHLLQTPYTNSGSFNQYPLICYRHLTPTVTPSTSIPHLLQTPYTNSDSFNQYPLICYRHLTPTVTPSTSIPSSVTDTLHQQWLLQPVSPHHLFQTPYTNSDSFNQYPFSSVTDTLHQQWLLQPVSPHLLQTPYTNSDSFNQYPLICYRHLTPTVTPSTSIPSSVTDTLHQQWLLQPVSPHLLQTPYTNSGSFNQYHLICYRHLTPTVTPSTSVPSSVTDTLHQQWLLQPVSPHLLQTPYTNSDSFNQYPLICYRHLTPTVTPSTSIPSSVTDTNSDSFNQYPLICFRHLTQWLLQPVLLLQPVSPHLLQTPYTNSDSFNQYPLICYRHLTPTVTPSTSIPSSVTDTLHQQWLLQPVSPHLLQTPYTNSDSFNQYPLICYRHLTPTVTPSTSIPSSVTDTLHQQWLLQPVSPHLLQTPYTNSDSFNQYPLILICYRHLTPTVAPSTSITSSVTDTLYQQWLLQPVSPHLLQTPYTNSGSFNQYHLICYRHLIPTVTPSTSITSSVTDTLTNSASFNQYPVICYRHLTPTVAPSTSITSSDTDTLYQQWLLQPVSPHLIQTPYTNSGSFNQYHLIWYRHLTPTVAPSTSITSSDTDTLHQQWLLQPVSSPHLLQTPYTNSDSFNQYPLIC